MNPGTSAVRPLASGCRGMLAGSSSSAKVAKPALSESVLSEAKCIMVKTPA
jgi:hypothetical protein